MNVIFLKRQIVNSSLSEPIVSTMKRRAKEIKNQKDPDIQRHYSNQRVPSYPEFIAPENHRADAAHDVVNVQIQHLSISRVLVSRRYKHLRSSYLLRWRMLSTRVFAFCSVSSPCNQSHICQLPFNPVFTRCCVLRLNTLRKIEEHRERRINYDRHSYTNWIAFEYQWCHCVLTAVIDFR